MKNITAQIRSLAASQAGAIEQSRAVAEVQAKVVVAQRHPRDPAGALSRALESCRQHSMAQQAFFQFPRGGQTVQGPTIHLAVELARCWGNIHYTISELDRDDARGVSEMKAEAWDLETNTSSAMTFIVPHKRDKKGGSETLTDLRDIYENNANQGARRLRECIFRVLPPFLIEQAKATCFETLKNGGDAMTLPERITLAIETFEGIGISRARLEAVYGPSSRWGAIEIANLQIAYQSIHRGEVSAIDQFPELECRLTGTDIIAQSRAAQSPVSSAPASPHPVAEEGQPGSDKQASQAPAGSEDGKPEPDLLGDGGGDNAIDVGMRIETKLKECESVDAMYAVLDEHEADLDALKADHPTIFSALQRSFAKREAEINETAQ